MQSTVTIENDAELHRVLERISPLMDARAGTPEATELMALVEAARQYQDHHYPIPKPDPSAVIKYALDSGRASLRDMVDIFGSRTALVNVLTRREAMDQETAATLHERYGYSIELLTAPFDSPPGWFTSDPDDMPWRQELKDAVTSGNQTETAST